MAGHSKWSTIKRKKGALDQKRGKLFSTISKEITVSSRLGGKEIDSNPRLRQAVKKAKSLNMPNSNIEKAIKKGVGELDNVIIEEVSYEGYGPFGVAILIEAITDNKNRTVADVRHALSKFGGSLGQAGSVSWNFERTGIVLIDKNQISENDIFEFSVENDCLEFFEDEDCFRLHFNSNDLYSKLDILENLNISVDSSFLAYVAKDEIKLSKDENEKVENLLDFLEELEDIQNVFSNQTLGLN
jgi:YebC/PmpR family DNA-binding regulatory protein|tara:strand:+ start:7152 stop:7880 length:729 start_codon:yes stop_codon:yes gene_type:complete